MRPPESVPISPGNSLQCNILPVFARDLVAMPHRSLLHSEDKVCPMIYSAADEGSQLEVQKYAPCYVIVSLFTRGFIAKCISKCYPINCIKHIQIEISWGRQPFGKLHPQTIQHGNKGYAKNYEGTSKTPVEKKYKKYNTRDVILSYQTNYKFANKLQIQLLPLRYQ